MKKENKKTNKKLVSAFAMLMLSAAMLGTATYAWFTMNKEVTVTGMNLQARSEGGIVIARSITPTVKNVSIDDPITDADDAKLLPTSTSAASTWFHAEAQVSSDEAAKAGTMKTLTLTNSAPTASALGYKYLTGPDGSTVQKYVLYDSFVVTPDGKASSFKNLWIKSCTVSSATKDLSKSMRVAFVDGSNVTICCPVSGASTTYTVGVNKDGTTDAGTSTTAYDSSATGTTPFAANTHVLKTGDALTAETVDVYIYFEGEDGNHYTDNLSDGIENLVVTFTLACDDTTAN